LEVVQPKAPRPDGVVSGERVYAGFVRVDRLNGNIGYIKLNSFPNMDGPYAATALQAMRDLSGTDAMIIDLRDNGGGGMDGLTYLCSFFFDPKTTVHLEGDIKRKAGTREFETTQYYTRPVPVSYLNKPLYFLTSKRTFSAGEGIAYDLQALRRARVVGEVTAGGANGGGNRELTSRFLMSIPMARTVNPVTGTNWEGVGVTPDVAVDERGAFLKAMREIVARSPTKYAAVKSLIEKQSSEDAFAEARLLKFRDQPLPGGAAAVRSLYAGIVSGHPDYGPMSDRVAKNMKTDLNFFHGVMAEQGEAKAVIFLGVSATGLDSYELRTATTAQRIAVYMGADGKIMAADFYPPTPLTP
jgi:hypothetical protein